MTDFEDLIDLFQQEFPDLHVSLSKEAFTYKIYSCEIESDTYIKFKRIKKIFNFLEKNVEIDDKKDEMTSEIYF